MKKFVPLLAALCIFAPLGGVDGTAGSDPVNFTAVSASRGEAWRSYTATITESITVNPGVKLPVVRVFLLRKTHYLTLVRGTDRYMRTRQGIIYWARWNVQSSMDIRRQRVVIRAKVAKNAPVGKPVCVTLQARSGPASNQALEPKRQCLKVLPGKPPVWASQ